MVEFPDGEPLVSAVITAYNRPEYLRTAIKSVVDQTYTNLEIIIVDDCSPTALEPTVQQFDDVRIRYIRQAKNGGPNVSRNTGIEAARGKYIAFLDDDDMWLPNKIERQLGQIQGHEACLGGWCYAGTDIKRYWKESIISEDTLRQGNYLCGTSGLMAEKQALEQTKFDTTLKNAQDWDVYIRLVQRQPLAYVTDVVFERRVGDHESITKSAKSARVEDIPIRISAMQKHRNWLGETNARRIHAQMALVDIVRRPQKLRILAYSVRHAGLMATLWWFWFKIAKREQKMLG